MKKEVDEPKPANFRQKAVKTLETNSIKSGSQLTKKQEQKLIHEHEMHQVELEMQNEKLQVATTEVKDATGKFTKLYDLAPSGYFTLSQEGKIVELNHIGAKLLGKERSKLKNTLFVHFVSANTQTVFNTFLAEVFNSETEVNCEVTLSATSNISVSVYLTGIISLDGLHCITTSMVINSKEHTNEKPWDNVTKYELAMKAANIAWWEMRLPEGHVTFGNRKAEMLGYSPEKFKHYNDFMALVHPEDSDKAMDAMRQHINGKTDKYETEYRILTKKGEYKWFYDLGSILEKDFEGKPKLIAGLVLDISNRKLAEENLIASESKYRRLFETAQDGILILDAETGMIQDVNPFLIQILGYPADQFIKKAVWDIGCFKDIIANYDKFIELQQKRYVRYDDLPLETKDGRKINVEFVSNVYSVGNVQVIQCNIRDISKQKQAEAAQLKVINRLSLACRAGGIGIWELDIPANTMIWDDQMFKLYGITADKFTGSYNEWRKRVYADDVQMVESELEKAQHGEIDFNAEFRIIWPDGTIHFIRSSADIRRDISGKAVRMVGTNFDITLHKQAELLMKQMLLEGEASRLALLQVVEDQKITGAALNNNKTLLYTLIQTIPDLVWLKDKEGKFISCNAMFERFFGACEADIIGKTDHDFVDPELADIFRQNDYKAMSDGKSVINEEMITFADDGHQAYLETIKTPMKDATGKLIGVLGIGRDITERKNAEQQLIVAREKAEESDRLKSAFLTNMSHEIRTPMNGILGFTDLLKEPKLTGEEQKEYIHIIEKSSERMLNIINDIINISKIESEQIDISLSEININSLIESLYKFFKPEVDLKGIQFHFITSLPEDQAIIQTDKDKVSAILTNLIKNAIKFSKSGDIVFGYEKKDNFLEFFIKDRGIGISKEQKTFIFERFRQGTESRTRNYEGAGLGLAISKAYVEILGGTIWVESELGAGSVFHFTIPYNCIPEKKKGTKIKMEESAEVNLFRELKILIVEDDEISKMLIKMVIQPLSKEIKYATTGKEAVETCRNNPDIELILMDIKMSEMDGYEATRQIRQFNKNVVIIAQTAFGMNADRKLAIEAGCNSYISKPIKISLLIELIKEYFPN